MKNLPITTLLACLVGVASLSLALPFGTADAQNRYGGHGAHHDHGSHFQPQPYHPSQSFPSRHVPSPRFSPRDVTCRVRCGGEIRLIAGYQRGKPKRPCGWHSVEWFRCRGYNLDNYSHVHRDGTVHHGRNVRR